MPVFMPPLDEIWKDRDALRDLFDFRHDNLGQDVLAASTRAIYDQSSRQLDPNDRPWAPLSKLYAAWKARVAPGKPIGILFGVMLSYVNIQGVSTISKYVVKQTYGVSPLARIEAVKFQEPALAGQPRQPERHFYAIAPSRVHYIDNVFDAYFQRWRLP